MTDDLKAAATYAEFLQIGKQEPIPAWFQFLSAIEASQYYKAVVENDAGEMARFEREGRERLRAAVSDSTHPTR